MVRASTSRAWSSVPSQCCASGGDGAGTGRSQATVEVAVGDRRPDQPPLASISRRTSGSL